MALDLQVLVFDADLEAIVASGDWGAHAAVTRGYNANGSISVYYINIQGLDAIESECTCRVEIAALLLHSLPKWIAIYYYSHYLSYFICIF